MTNAHTRDFAQQHRLRTSTLADGHTVLRLGRRSTRPEDANAAFTFPNRLVWSLYVKHPQPGRLAALLREAGCPSPQALDGELVADVPEPILLQVLDASKWTKPQRKRVDAGEHRAFGAKRNLQSTDGP